MQRPIGLIIYELGLEISFYVNVCEMLVFGAVGGSHRIDITRRLWESQGFGKLRDLLKELS